MATVTPIDTAYSPLHFALRYARIGWHVVPLWWAEEGESGWHCACGATACRNPAKHPIERLVTRGQKDATVDESLIRQWFTAFPKANIGIVLAPSGLVGVDIDPRNGGVGTIDDLEVTHGALDSGVLQFTGGGGEHRVFALPQEAVLNLPGKLGSGVDLKRNGYLVVEPSVHISGKRYGWEASSDPLDGAIPEPLPDWIRGLSVREAAPASAPSSRAPLPAGELERLAVALAMIPSDDRETWLRVGMAVHNDVGGQDGFALWERWSRGSTKFDAVDQMRVWRSFRRRPMGEAIQLPTVYALAYEHGFRHKESPPAGVEMVGTLTMEEAERLADNVSFTVVSGAGVAARPFPVAALNDIVALCTESYAQTHVLASQATALAVMAACAARRYVSEHGDPAHLFVGVLAPTVSQVRYTMTAAENLFMAAGLRSQVRGQRFTSPAQLYATILRNPATLYLADDYGDQLRFARRQPSGLLEQALSILSGRVYAGQTIALDNWAEVGLKPERSTSNLPTLHRPALSMLATVAQSQLVGLFRRSEFARGALDAMLLVPAIDESWVDRPAGRPIALPPNVVEIMRALRGFEPGQTEQSVGELLSSLALQEPTPIVVRFAADIQSVERAWIDRALRMPPSARALAIGSRKILRRMAIAMAAWADPKSPVVTDAILAWCNAFAGECLQVMLDEFELLGSDDDDKPDTYQMLLDAITRCGPGGMPRRDLHKFCKPFRKLDPEARGKLLDAMVSDRALYTVPTISGRGVQYVSNRFIQEKVA